jgi:hypothetical protein
LVRKLTNDPPVTRCDEEAAEVFDEWDHRDEMMATVAFARAGGGWWSALDLAIGIG